MQEISAIVGLKNLQKIDIILENRKKNILKYKKYFESEDKVNFFSTMCVKENVECNYLYYPIILKEEATNFVNYLQSNGIMVRRYYTAVHRLDFYKNKYKKLNLDFTELIKDKIVSIPIHTIMSDEEINYIFSTINNYFKI
jgi:dTDP-4-amino-4,6-dideoxygalactose transaminase